MGNLREAMFCYFCGFQTSVIGSIREGLGGEKIIVCWGCEKLSETHILLKCLRCGELEIVAKRDFLKRNFIIATKGAIDDLVPFRLKNGCKKCPSNKRR